MLQLYVFARWLGSPHFTPAPIGDSPQPQFWQKRDGELAMTRACMCSVARAVLERIRLD